MTLQALRSRRERWPRLCWSVAAFVSLIAVAVLAQEPVRRQSFRGAIAVSGPDSSPKIPVGPAIILGQVVEAGTTRGVPGAAVIVTMDGASPRVVLSDSEGRFAFQLPFGRFALRATRSGYAEGAVGRRRPGGFSEDVELTENRKRASVTVPLWPLAALEGSVRFEDNEPAVRVEVKVLRQGIVGGRWQAMPAATAMTDDRGVYRIGGLEPGTYAVLVPVIMGASMDAVATALPISAESAKLLTVGRGRSIGSLRVGMNGTSVVGNANADLACRAADRRVSYHTQYYPQASSLNEAVSISLDAGERRLGVDFRLEPAAAVRVSGVLQLPPGAVRRIAVTLLSMPLNGAAYSPIESADAISDGEGRFMFDCVLPGQYLLRALWMPELFGATPGTLLAAEGSNAQRLVLGTQVAGTFGHLNAKESPLWGEAIVSVSSNDVQGLAVPMREGSPLSGALQLDDRSSPEDLQRVTVWLDPADARTALVAGGPAPGEVQPSGQFRVIAVPDGSYALRVEHLPSGTFLHSVVVRGQEAPDGVVTVPGAGLDSVTVRLTKQPIRITGTVTNVSGEVSKGRTVAVFPSDPHMWSEPAAVLRRVRVTRTNDRGLYLFEGLPSGDYFLTAVDDELSDQVMQPRVLTLLSQTARRLLLNDRETRTLPLTWRPVRRG